jgi:hypothetical protein
VLGISMSIRLSFAVKLEAATESFSNWALIARAGGGGFLGLRNCNCCHTDTLCHVTTCRDSLALPFPANRRTCAVG